MSFVMLYYFSLNLCWKMPSFLVPGQKFLLGKGYRCRCSRLHPLLDPEASFCRTTESARSECKHIGIHGKPFTPTQGWPQPQRMSTCVILFERIWSVRWFCQTCFSSRTSFVLTTPCVWWGGWSIWGSVWEVGCTFWLHSQTVVFWRRDMFKLKAELNHSEQLKGFLI